MVVFIRLKKEALKQTFLRVLSPVRTSQPCQHSQVAKSSRRLCGSQLQKAGVTQQPNPVPCWGLVLLVGRPPSSALRAGQALGFPLCSQHRSGLKNCYSGPRTALGGCLRSLQAVPNVWGCGRNDRNMHTHSCLAWLLYFDGEHPGSTFGQFGTFWRSKRACWQGEGRMQGAGNRRASCPHLGPRKRCCAAKLSTSQPHFSARRNVWDAEIRSQKCR